MTTGHPHFYLEEKRQRNILFCVKVWERLPRSKTFASILANFENDHEEQEASDKTTYKKRGQSKCWTDFNTASPKRTCSSSPKQVILISRQFRKIKTYEEMLILKHLKYWGYS